MCACLNLPALSLIAVIFLNRFSINSTQNGYIGQEDGQELEETEKIHPTIACLDSACDAVNVRFGSYDFKLTKTRDFYSEAYKKELEKSPKYDNASAECTSNCHYEFMSERKTAFLSICEGRVSGVVVNGEESYELHYNFDDNEHTMSKIVYNGTSMPIKKWSWSEAGSTARLETSNSAESLPSARLYQQPLGLLNVLFAVEPGFVQRLGSRNAVMNLINQYMAIAIPAFRIANVQASLSGIDFWPDQRVPVARSGNAFTASLHRYWATTYLPTGQYHYGILLTDRTMFTDDGRSTVRGIVTVNTVCGRQAISYLTPSRQQGVTFVAIDVTQALGAGLGANGLVSGQCGCTTRNPCWELLDIRRPANRWSNCSLQIFATKIRSPEGDCLTRNGPPTTTTATAPSTQPPPLPPTSRPPPGPSTTTTTATTPDAPTTAAETEPVPLEAGPNYLLFGLLGLLLLLLLIGLLIFVVVKKKKRDGQLRSRFDPSSNIAASNAMRSSYAGGSFAGSTAGSQRSGLSRMFSGNGSSHNAMSQQSARSGTSRVSGAGSTFADQRSRFSGVSNASAASLASRRSRFTGSRI